MSPANNSGSKERIDCVQMLRAIAAIAVVTYHIPIPGKVFGNGGWGVDMFFVISGFIMCYVTQKPDPHFFAKRLIRIVPLYWTGTVAVFLLAMVAPRLVNHKLDLLELVKSLTFIPFQKGEDVNPILFLGWTLNYEMFFYLLFALSMRLDHGHRAKICAGLLALFVGAGVLLRANGAMIHTGSVAVRFYTKAILGEFILGMLCFEIFTRTSAFRSGNRPAHSQLIWTALGLALLVCIPLADFLAPDTDRFLRWGLLAAASFSCLMHGLGGVRLPVVVVAVGDASYSLYLFHPYVIQIFDKIFKCFAVADARAFAMSCSAIALCCGLAVLSYRMIEQPLTGRLRRLLPGEHA